MDGAEPRRLAFHIQSAAGNIASYSFSLPNGDLLLALWTNGTAVEHDPGVTADLTFRGSATTLVGMDAFMGFQQQLITSQAGGTLVLEDLVVRDYPIFLHLVGWGR